MFSKINNQQRFKLIASVYVMLIRDGKILLLRRFNTGYEDGNYGLVAGHLDGDEKATDGMMREASEEAGIVLKAENLKMVHVMHRRQDDERIDFFFMAEKWEGEIENKEPGKCDDLSWFSLDSLPENTIPYIKNAIVCMRSKTLYSEYWHPEAK